MDELAEISQIPIETAVLYNFYPNLKSPKDRVRRAEAAGELIRLKKGLYIVSPVVSKINISAELIANHLHGPSYVSFESALSYYGLIPERVFTVKSATAKRRKIYETPVGVFEYISISPGYFPIGLQTIIVKDSFAFVIASPEKALCDLIISTSRLRFQSQKAVKRYLNEDIRVDFGIAKNWNADIITQCIQHSYKKTELTFLLNYLRDEHCI
jgi:hypothetical protein